MAKIFYLIKTTMYQDYLRFLMCAFHLFEYGNFFHFLVLFFGLKSVHDKINKIN